MKTSFWRVVRAVVSKDLRVELRSRELLATMLLFALLSVLAFSFALELDRVTRTEVISGVLWVTLVFASILGLNRSMASERENWSMEAILLAPIERSAVYIGKLIGNTLVTLSVGVILLPLMSLLYTVNLFSPWLWLVLGLGILGICTSGTLIAAMTVQTRSREALLPIAMLPVVLPLIFASVRASTGIVNNAPFTDWNTWVMVLGIVDTIYLVLCFWLFGAVVEE